MNEVKHTPERWQIVMVGDDNPKPAIANADRHSILTLAYEDGVAFAAVYDEAHADLTAAAPEMLEALEHALTLLEPFEDHELSLGLGPDALKPIRAAIAKAKGLTP